MNIYWAFDIIAVNEFILNFRDTFSVMCRKFWMFMWMKEEKIYFFRTIFLSGSEKVTFEKENVLFSSTFLFNF